MFGYKGSSAKYIVVKFRYQAKMKAWNKFN